MTTAQINLFFQHTTIHHRGVSKEGIQHTLSGPLLITGEDALREPHESKPMPTNKTGLLCRNMQGKPNEDKVKEGRK